MLKDAYSRRRFIAGAGLSCLALASPTKLAARGLGSPGLDHALAAALQSDPELAGFYAERGYAPLWLASGRPGAEAQALLVTLSAARLDGLDPTAYLPAAQAAVDMAATASADRLAMAEIDLSRTFARFVQAVRRVPKVGVIYGEPGYMAVPGVRTILSHAAQAPGLADYISKVGWMHPRYRDLRAILEGTPGAAGDSQTLARLNLDRARALPAYLSRYILVDTTAAQLLYYEGGALRDTMKVVVGTSDDPTPMMVSTIYYATLQPYWHVPVDLTQERIAPRVVSEGMEYFNSRGYEVSTDWTPSARVIDPTTVDWKAVASGRSKVFVRQKPGPRNGMGKFKFQFANDLGIYLHDTSAKQLFAEQTRGLSAGCVRLEDAERLGALLNAGARLPEATHPEQHVRLPEGVPLFITYLSAAAEGDRLVERGDPYGWDRKHLAMLNA